MSDRHGDWPRLRLKRLFSSVVGGAWGSDPTDDVELVAPCIRGTDFDVDRLRVNLDRAPDRGFTLSEFQRRAAVSGDIIIEKSGGGEKQPVGRVVLYDGSSPVMPTNFAARLRPAAPEHPQFVTYLMAGLYGAGYTRAAINQTTGIQNLDLEALLSTVVSVPSLSGQQAIADFLDDETARIDAIIAKKRRLINLLDEQLASQIDSMVWLSDGQPTPLMRIVPPRRRIMYGIVLPGPDVEDGVPIVKGGNVKSHKLNLAAVARTAHEIEARYARSRLQEGDLVFAIRGGVGDVEMVPSELEEANITQDVARIVAGEGVNARWLLHALRARTTQGEVESRITGATIRGINIWDLERIRVPLPAIDEQSNTSARLDQVTADHAQLTSVLSRQIELLAEHRQALITAAVTGEFDVARRVAEEVS